MFTGSVCVLLTTTFLKILKKLLLFLGGFRSFQVVSGSFRWFQVVPCFSNYGVSLLMILAVL